MWWLWLCVVDPVSDDVREVVAVAQPEVTRDDLARFVLLADSNKMEGKIGGSKLKFRGANRRLRDAARPNTASAVSQSWRNFFSKLRPS